MKTKKHHFTILFICAIIVLSSVLSACGNTINDTSENNTAEQTKINCFEEVGEILSNDPDKYDGGYIKSFFASDLDFTYKDWTDRLILTLAYEENSKSIILQTRIQSDNALYVIQIFMKGHVTKYYDYTFTYDLGYPVKTEGTFTASTLHTTNEFSYTNYTYDKYFTESSVKFILSNMPEKACWAAQIAVRFFGAFLKHYNCSNSLTDFGYDKSLEEPVRENDVEPKADFEIEKNGNTCTITKYNGFAEKVVIPEGIDGCKVTVIGRNAFADNSFIKEVVIPHGVTTIKSGAFEWCENLSSATIPASVETIENGGFCGCGYRMTIYYEGTRTQWSNLIPYEDSGYSDLVSANVIYNYDY